MLFLVEVKPEVFEKDWVRLILSMLSNRKKLRLPPYLGLSHTPNYLRQTNLNIYLHRCTQTHSRSSVFARALKSPPLMRAFISDHCCHQHFHTYVFESALTSIFEFFALQRQELCKKKNLQSPPASPIFNQHVLTCWCHACTDAGSYKKKFTAHIEFHLIPTHSDTPTRRYKTHFIFLSLAQ